MRLPLPTRFAPKNAAIFIAFIFAAELMCGTNIVYTLLTCVYIALWTLGFNIAGGLVYPSGAFIFFNGFLSVIVASIAKIMFFEPAEKNLRAPILLMEVYCAGMIAMIFAAFVCRGLRPQKGLLKDFDTLAQLKTAAIVCFVIGYLPELLGLSRAAGSVYSALAQLNLLPMMAVMLATIYEIRRSNGKRSVNWIVWASSGVAFVSALVNFGKAGMLIGFTAWILTAVVFRYNFAKLQILGIILAFSFFNYYLVPYSQLVRTYRAPTLAENEVVAMTYLKDLNATREEFLATIDEMDLSDEWHLFDKRPPFLERLIVIAPDDFLINFTSHDHTVGLSPTTNAYLNVIPHFLWKDKPAVNVGNDFAHELGILDDDDTTTGIAFSPAAEFFHQATWLGVLVIWPLVIFLFFILTDSLTGSAMDAPWALLPILVLSQAAQGGGVTGTVYQTTDGTLGLLLTYFLVMHAAPFVLRSFGRSGPTPIKTAPSTIKPVLDAV